MKIEDLFKRYESIIPDFDLFMEYARKPLTKSFRLNTLKARREEILDLLRDIAIKPLPFYDDGFYLEDKISIGNTASHSLGLIYAQEPASMVPVLVLDPKPGETVLDLCAAPGSKTTQIAQIMQNSGLVVANEVNRQRISGLVSNSKRCGLINEVITSKPGEKIGQFAPEYFDRVLIDAPCSTEGTIRRSKAVLFHWGLKNIQKMARLQKGLAVSGYRSLKPGGIMVYSTCTIAPEENEAVISYLLEKLPDAQVLPIEIPNFKIRPGIRKWQNQVFGEVAEKCCRILPQDNNTAPFFIAKIFKPGKTSCDTNRTSKIPQKSNIIESLVRRFNIDPSQFKGHAIFQEQDTYYISTPEVYAFEPIKAIRKGLELGKVYDQELKPDNDFVQIFGRQAKRNSYEMTQWQLKKFLSNEKIEINVSSEISQGFIIVTHNNLPIGIGRYNGKDLKPTIKMDRRITS